MVVKKKIILAVVWVSVLALIPVAVFADKVISDPWTKNIYKVSDPDEGSRTYVSTFDDSGNKCYVVYHLTNGVGDGNSAAISCVKGK